MNTRNVQLVSLLDLESTEKLIEKVYYKYNMSYVGSLYYSELKQDKDILLHDYSNSEVSYTVDEYLVFCHPLMISFIQKMLDKPVIFLYIEKSNIARKNTVAFLDANTNDKNLNTFYYDKKDCYFQVDRVSLLEIRTARLELELNIKNNGKSYIYWRTKDNNFCSFTYEEFIDFADKARKFKEDALQVTWKILDDDIKNKDNITITYSS
jgi:hypothetical protein